MPLSLAQLQAIRADITASPDLAAQPNSSDGNYEVARLYNLPATPTFWVYRTLVTLREIVDTMDWSEVGNLTTANNERLQSMGLWAVEGVNPASSATNIRAFFDNVFSGAVGTNTRAALAALWRRPARRAERLFVTGTGSTAAPGMLVWEGVIAPADIEQARQS
jgi:hypothetical protein